MARGMTGSTIPSPTLTLTERRLPSSVLVTNNLTVTTTDAAGELYDLFTAKGAKVFGMTSQDGYDHVESKAVYDDKFCGLMCDEDNQYDMSEERVGAWVTQLKDEGFM